MPVKKGEDEADFDGELEYLELQECTNEIEDLVHGLREELHVSAGCRSPRKDVHADALPNNHGSPKREFVIQPLPNALEPSTPAEHLGASKILQETVFLGHDKEVHLKEMPLKQYLKAVMERLSRLELRLEEWRDEQRGLIEHNVGGGGGRYPVPPHEVTRKMAARVAESGLEYDLLKEWSKQSVSAARRTKARTSHEEVIMPDGFKGSPAKRSSVNSFPPVPEETAQVFTKNGGQSSCSDAKELWPNSDKNSVGEEGNVIWQDSGGRSEVSSSTGEQGADTNGTHGVTWQDGPHYRRASSRVRSSGKPDAVMLEEDRRRNGGSTHSGDSSRSSRRGSGRLRDATNGGEVVEVYPTNGAVKSVSKEKSGKRTLTTGSTFMAPGEGGMLWRIVFHPAFDYFFASMIILNSLFIGVQTEVNARLPTADEEPREFEIVEQIFAVLFALELVMRMGALKMAFFNFKNITWNVFDMLLVAMSGVELVLNTTTTSSKESATDTSGTAGKVIRMFRMARIVRIMRVLRFLAELRIMVTLIMNSARSLFWLMILLLGILYIFSIFFTQGVTDLLRSSEDVPDDIVGHLRTDYGTMVQSSYTLFASITGGVSWRDVLNPLSTTGPGFAALFILYVFFCIFSVLNIVTGVFVDGAIQRSSQERDLRLEKEKEQKKMYVSMLTDLLEEIDSDGTGVITREDLEEAFTSEQVRYYFSVLDIDVVDSNYLFDMLDLDRSGEVDMEEFVSGCLRLKGNAKSIDIHTLMYEIKLMIKQMSFFMEYFFREAKGSL